MLLVVASSITTDKINGNFQAIKKEEAYHLYVAR